MYHSPHWPLAETPKAELRAPSRQATTSNASCSCFALLSLVTGHWTGGWLRAKRPTSRSEHSRSRTRGRPQHPVMSARPVPRGRRAGSRRERGLLRFIARRLPAARRTRTRRSASRSRPRGPVRLGRGRRAPRPMMLGGRGCSEAGDAASDRRALSASDFLQISAQLFRQHVRHGGTLRLQQIFRELGTKHIIVKSSTSNSLGDVAT